MSAEASDAELVPLLEGAAALGVPLDAVQVERFARLRAMLLDWNTRVNLTAITDPAEVATRLFLDALTCLLALPAAAPHEPRVLLDVGSGAGFPGLALAIACPRWQVTSLEATAKKVRFQQAVIAELGLTNARTIAGRAEELAHTAELRARFELVTARALAALAALLEYCAPFARVGGVVIAPKKGELVAEIAAGRAAAKLLGARLLPPIPVTVPPLDDGRVLVVARQERPCPAQYPRAGGAPLKRPLGA
jgi:16S rRNA (guanine527-N7)-methyltransferase